MILIANCAAILGNLQYIRGNKEKAVRYFQYAIKKKTGSPQAHLNYAIHLLRGGQAREAQPLLDRALSLSKKILPQKHAKLTQASCRWMLGDVDGAIEILEKMRRDYDYVNASVLSTLAYMYVLKGDYALGEALSRKAIEDTPSAYSAWDNIGQIYFRQERPAEAREAFLKALEFKEDLPDSLYYLGRIAEAEGDIESAERFFERALACEIMALNTVTREQIELARQELKKRTCEERN